MNKKVLIATGGSGGHIIPALAIAQELKANNVTVEFIGSAGGFSHLIEKQGFVFHTIKAFKYNNRGLLGKLKAIIFVYIGILSSIIKMRKNRPDYVLGMGGYASIATVFAAKLIGIDTALHEQNVRPGKTNRLLIRFADKIFLSFEETKQFLSNKINKKNDIVVAGCPVEQKIIDAKKLKRSKDKKFRIFIMGGSQGARILSDVVPQALITLPEEIKKDLIVVQQTRQEDIQRVESIYNEYKIDNTVATYFDDVEKKFIDANLVIGRSGAGTVCETATLGRVSIFVPLLLADGHQMENARVLADKNAAFILETGRFTPSNLAYEVLRLIENPEILKTMEKNSSKALPQCLTAAKTIADDIIQDLKKDD